MNIIQLFKDNWNMTFHYQKYREERIRKYLTDLYGNIDLTMKEYIEQNF